MKKIYILLLCALFSMRPASAQFSNALNFDGGNDYVSSAVPAVFNNLATQSLTIEAWVKPSAFTFSRILFVQGNTTSNFASLSLSTGGVIYFYIGTGTVSGSSASTTSSLLTLNQWSHIAATWNAATSAIEIYIDGALASTAGGGTTSTGTTNTMTIGARSGTAQFYNGNVDELRIWNTVRTAAEITTNKNTELTLPQTGLVAYYKFNQGIANANNPTVTTLDEALNTTNGTLNNFALTGATSNWVANTLALPLNWLSVNGKLNTAREAELSWKVQEKQVTQYIVERSVGAKSFSPVATVNSKGDGVHEYSFTDRNPSGGTNYYRLKQVDKDGRFSYSVIMTINLEDNNTGVRVYPNPPTAILHVTRGKGKDKFNIYDGTGRMIFTALPDDKETLDLDISAWQSGLYFYRAGAQQGSFIKQ